MFAVVLGTVWQSKTCVLGHMEAEKNFTDLDITLIQ